MRKEDILVPTGTTKNFSMRKKIRGDVKSTHFAFPNISFLQNTVGYEIKQVQYLIFILK
jgi:hypothetical protein